MPTSPILSYFVRQTEQNTIILLYAYQNTIFPHNVCLPLSLSLLLIYFLPNNNFRLWSFSSRISLRGIPVFKNKIMTGVYSLLAPISFLLYLLTVLYCTARSCVSLWLYPVYPVLIFGSSPHRTAKQLFSCP